MMRLDKVVFMGFALTFGVFFQAKGQLLNSGKISGNFQMDAQYSKADTLTGAPEVKEKMLMNAFANVIYTNDNFTAGVRYEMYQNPMLGFDSRYKGSGIPYRFASYTKDDWTITVGNFYEQFGNGLIFRSYEERNLGYDNAMDGIRLKIQPAKGITFKGVWGNQRYFFEKGIGIVRGLDGEINFNELCSKLSGSNFRMTLGGSFVSKYQEDQDPEYFLPENVASMAGRMSLGYKKININAEYAYKFNDPSAVNGMIYKPGDALYLSASYSQKGLGVLLNGLKVDNMDFRSDRSMTGNPLIINYLPALTRQHAYSLSAFYPYGTQSIGQIGYQAQVDYKIKKNTLLGGKYGMSVALNYSNIHALRKMALNDTTFIGQSGTDGYKSDFISWSDEKYFTDFNIEIGKKISSKWKMLFNYVYLEYNKAVIEGHPGEPMVCAHVGIADLTYKINAKNSVRVEMQHLSTQQDLKNWALLLVEYSVAPGWFFTLSDMYNYENPEVVKRIHYFGSAVTYVKGTTRVALGYGKQRQGIVCVGGVCRQVPASNGLTLTVVSSF